MAEMSTFSIERITLCGFKARSASVLNNYLFFLLSRTSLCFILDTLVPFGELFLKFNSAFFILFHSKDPKFSPFKNELKV